MKDACDPRLVAQIVRRERLFYAEGPSEAEDRPAFVRSASACGWLGAELAIVQDDAAFIGLRDKSGSVRAIHLPRGPGGRRRFEERLGNKNDKYDFEACASLPDGRLLVIGSGARAEREVFALLASVAETRASAGAATSPKNTNDTVTVTVQLVPAADFYASLRAALGGGLINFEGALVDDGALRFFNRGGYACANASVDVALGELVEHLERGGPVPRVRATAEYELHAIAGVPFGFTDVTRLGDGRVAFLAAAEDTQNPIDDGAVLGTRFGVFDGAELRFAPVIDESGEARPIKAEGLVLDREDPSRFWLVIDPDDPDCPAELCELHVAGL